MADLLAFLRSLIARGADHRPVDAARTRVLAQRMEAGRWLI